MWEELEDAVVLVVDDDQDVLTLTSRALKAAGCPSVVTTTDPFRARSIREETRADLVLLDFNVPPLDGFAILEELWAREEMRNRVPVVMMTGAAAPELRLRALELGVSDFLAKDFDHAELILRVRNTIRSRRLLQQVEQQRVCLEELVEVRTRELEQARSEILERLALAAEYRDDQTIHHTRRVGQLSRRIAEGLGESRRYCESIEAAAQLHDLGKIGIPDAILLKPGPLTAEEYSLVKDHPEIGSQILMGCTAPVLQMAQEIALTHHERWDGFGYPRRLKGDEIPLAGRIVALADAFDTMTSERPYKRAISHAEALGEVNREIGGHFDPQIVAVFLDVIQNWDGHGSSHRDPSLSHDA